MWISVKLISIAQRVNTIIIIFIILDSEKTRRATVDVLRMWTDRSIANS
jgi:hypothetical protein